jgi:hypothetical protein
MGNKQNKQKRSGKEKIEIENVVKSKQQKFKKPIEMKTDCSKSILKKTITSSYNYLDNDDNECKYSDNDLGELKSWLTHIGNRLIVYKDAFASHGFDSLESLATIRKQDLNDLNVKTGHKRILLAAVKNLKEDLTIKKKQANVKKKEINLKIDIRKNKKLNQVKLKPIIKVSNKKNVNDGGIEDDKGEHHTDEFKRVIRFLKSLPGDFSCYSRNFKNYGYDSIEAILLMKEADVDAVIPSNKRGHRQLLLHGIVDLNRKKQTSTAPKIEICKSRYDDIHQQKIGANRHFNNTRDAISRINVESMLYDVNVENLDENDLLTAASQPRLSPRSRLSRVEKVIVNMTKTPAALRTDLKHVYVLSGRDRLPTHKKRYIGGEGKYSRWDGYAFTSERYNPEIDLWST